MVWNSAGFSTSGLMGMQIGIHVLFFWSLFCSILSIQLNFFLQRYLCEGFLKFVLEAKLLFVRVWPEPETRSLVPGTTSMKILLPFAYTFVSNFFVFKSDFFFFKKKETSSNVFLLLFSKLNKKILKIEGVKFLLFSNFLNIF